MNLALPTGPLAQAVGWALLHLLWQGALVAALLAATLAVLAGRSANLRYALSCAALALIVALGVATAIRSYPSVRSAAAPPTTGTLSIHGPIPTVSSLAAAPIDHLGSVVRAAHDALPWIVVLWLAGVALCSARLVLEWLRTRRLVMRGASPARESWQAAVSRLASALGVRRAVQVLESAAVEVPSVVGLLRPAILLPASTLTGLTPAQLEMILAHELAHVRRHDVLVNLLQAVTETLLFYHPAVWWISRRIRVEREHCCDDRAIAVCGSRAQYARALTRLEELRGRAPRLVAAATGGSLLERIRRIAAGSHSATGAAGRGVTALAVLACVLLAFAAPTLPAIGEWEPHMRSRHAPERVEDPVPLDRAERTEQRQQAEQPQQSEQAARLAAVDATSSGSGDHRFEDSDSSDDATVSGDDEDSSSGDDGEDGSAPDATPRHGKLTIDELIELRAQDVTPETIREVRALFPDLDVREIASMSAVGATPAFVREMRGAGLEVRTAREAEGLAAVGVTAEAMRGWRDAGLHVTSAHQAQSLAAVGVTPQFIRDMRSAGLAVETVRDAQGLAAVGVTPEFLREMRDAGLAVESARDAQQLSALGVTPEFVRHMAEAGYSHLTVDEWDPLESTCRHASLSIL